MPEELKVIWILAVCLSVACAAGYIAQKMKLSPILGYLFAGYLLGPNSPGYIVNQYISDQLANIGVTLLMFAVGLNFNWKDISAVKMIVLPGAIILSLLSIAAGIFLSTYLGETLIAGLVVGIAICVSSTVVIVRVLTENNLIQTKEGHIVMGWTIIEDLVSVLGLIILPALVAPSFSSEVGQFASIAYSIFIILAKIAALLILVYFVGEKLIEKILKVIARTKSNELFTLVILACVFLVAVGSSYVFGISLALGAFIAGTVIGKTELSHQAAANALPMRDAFAVIFFLSVGMLFDPITIKNNIPLFTSLLIIILLLRPLITFLILKIAKYPSYVGFTVAFSISQIGEYSFIIAEEGSRLRILPDNAYYVIIATAFMSIALNPILFQLFIPMIRSKKKLRSGGMTDGDSIASNECKCESYSHLPQAIIVGYGPIGQTIGQYLKNKYRITVIDHNIDTVSLKENNIEIIFGDASQSYLLQQAHVGQSQLIVITISDIHATESIIKISRQMNPNIEMIARIHIKSEHEPIKFENVRVVFDEEATAQEMIKALSQQ